MTVHKKINLFFLNCQQEKIHETSNGISKQIKFLQLLVNTLCKQQLELRKSEILVILIPVTHLTITECLLCASTVLGAGDTAVNESLRCLQTLKY